MDNKDCSGLLLQNKTRSLPSKHAAIAEAFSNPVARDYHKYFSPANERYNHFQLLRFQCWIPKLLSVHQTTLPTMHSGQSVHDLDCNWDCDWATLGGLKRVGVRVVPEFVGNLWSKQNTAIWLELHDFMQQTQNLVLAYMQPNYLHTQYVGLRPTRQNLGCVALAVSFSGFHSSRHLICCTE